MRVRRAAVESAVVVGLFVGFVAGCRSALRDETGGEAAMDAGARDGGRAHDDAAVAMDGGVLDGSVMEDAGPLVDGGIARDGGGRGTDLDSGFDEGGDRCPVPLTPVLSVIDDDEVLRFTAPPGVSVELAVLTADAPIDAAVFSAGRKLLLAGRSGPTRVLARAAGCSAGCSTGCSAGASTMFDVIYDVRDTYAPSPPAPATTAVRYDDPRLVGWATGVESYAPGTGIGSPRWMQPDSALGPAGSDTTDVVTLGDGGHITLAFDPPITDGDGWDFAVFENSFAADTFLELGFVEVSSDGIHFLRFDAAFRGTERPCAGCSGRAFEIGGLAGTYPVGYGTPFDLAALANAPEARAGIVELDTIRYVRIVDVIGDGQTLDSFGRGIVDPLAGGPAPGFDLDAVGVLHSR